MSRTNPIFLGHGCMLRLPIVRIMFFLLLKREAAGRKDFKVSYHEALREAFTSFEDLNYNPLVAENSPSEKRNSEKDLPKEVIVDPVVTAEEIDEVAAVEPSPEAQNVPSEVKKTPSEARKIQKFTNGPVTYRLETTPAGFELFKEGEQQKFASLMKSGGGENYLYSSKNVSGNAFFDRQGNLVVEYLDPNSQQLITVIYKLQAQ